MRFPAPQFRKTIFFYRSFLTVQLVFRPECSYRSMWDLEDPTNINRESLCDVITDSISGKRPGGLEPFRIVYNSHNYVVFEV